MKLLAGCAVSAGLVLAAWSANAQMLAPHGAVQSPYQAVSDFDEPYGGVPPAPPPYAAPPPPYGAPPPAYYAPRGAPYGYEPALMPLHEVYAVLRDNGFLPLGIPRRQGYAYEISAMDPDGEDGRLLIDGRNGRIIRFTPASYWMGRTHDSELTGVYGAQAALPPPIAVRGVPRPPAPIPHVASRAVPLPAPKPAQTAAATSPPQVSAAAPPPPTSGTVGEVKPPPPAIRPTQNMPAVQGLE
ncbi:hypothetical protein [Bradyrhizobium sp. Tv2a-2]|uniref:hypothetical protein n=1 Tax=Bradyrhizobium sp. Tv2a-2 TaxID=113395 RepID=UPI000428E7C9|nr:hypothetical protein [Bradyrhizobium sp. Tv2a-2]